MAEKTTTLEPFDLKHAHTLLALAGKWVDYISVMDPKPPLTIERFRQCVGAENYTVRVFVAVSSLVNQAADWEASLRKHDRGQ